MNGALELIQSYARDRDPKAFAAIVRAYQALVYRVCLRIHGNAHQAEDSTQECFLLLARDAEKVTTSLPGWLHRCATRVALGTIRSDNARRHRERVYGQKVSTVNETTQWEEIAHEVDTALDELPDDLRELLVKHFLCQRTQTEIAQDLDVSGATVSRRMDRAIKALQRNLKKAGAIVTASILVSLLTNNAAAAAVPVSLSAALGKLALAAGGKASAASGGTAAIGGTILTTTKVAAAAGVCILAAVAYMTFKPTEPKPTLPGETVNAETEPVVETAEPAPAPEPAPPPPPEPVSVEDEEVVASATFDDVSLNEVDLGAIDPALNWSAADGVARLTGTTSDTRWGGNSLNLPLTIDTRTNIEISADFKIVKSNGYCLIALSSSKGLCMFYQGTPPGGHYVIQRRWMEYPITLEGTGRIEAFGDEMTQFHQLRMLVDRSKRQISYYVDEVLLGDVHYNEDTELAPLEHVHVEHEAPQLGTEIEIHWDNLNARSFGPLYPPAEED